MQHKYSDYEIWDKYSKAQAEADRWLEEARARKLLEKPICEWSVTARKLVKEE